MKEVMRAQKKLHLGSAALCVALLLAATASATTRSSSSVHEQLALWAGHWKVRIRTEETPFSHARTDDYDSECAFFPHGAILFCDYLSLQPDAHSGRVLNDIAVICYSDVDKTFKYTNVAPEGGPREDIMLVHGNVWTRPFKFPGRNGAVVDAREIYTFVSPDKQLGRLELSSDNGAHWTVVNEAVGTRER